MGQLWVRMVAPGCSDLTPWVQRRGCRGPESTWHWPRHTLSDEASGGGLGSPCTLRVHPGWGEPPLFFTQRKDTDGSAETRSQKPRQERL